MKHRLFLRAVELALVGRGKVLAVFVFLAFGVRLVVAQTQTAPLVAPATQGPSMFWTGTTSDPWFWSMIGAWLFSSIVSGMPEPQKTDSPFYIWVYRSLHLIVATGTSYFQHKDLWVEPAPIAVVVKKEGESH